MVSRGKPVATISEMEERSATEARLTITQLSGEDRNMTLSVDARACKGMLLRNVMGEVKHLSTQNQLWVQGAIQNYSLEVLEAPRTEDVSDILTHPAGES